MFIVSPIPNPENVIRDFLNRIKLLGIGDWGLGIGDWGLGIGPNPQSPIRIRLLKEKLENISCFLEFKIILKKLFFL